MKISKRISVFTILMTLMCLHLTFAAVVNDIIPKSVSPDIEPGWKGSVRVKFIGVFDVSSTSLSTASEDSQIQIISASITSSVSVGSEYEAEMELIVETSIKAKMGKVGFAVSDGSGNRVKGYFKVKNYSSVFNEAKPSSVNGGGETDLLLIANKDFLVDSMILKQLILPSSCSIISADMTMPNKIKTRVNIPESASGKNLSFYFQIGDVEHYQTYAGTNLVPVAYDYIRVLEADPSNVMQGNKNVLIHLKGKNLSPSTKVFFSDPGIEIGALKYISSNMIDATVNVLMKAKPGPIDVMVSDRGLNHKGIGLLTVKEAVKPVITRVEPGRVHYQKDPIQLTINGEGFSKDTNFSISGKGIKILSQTILGANDARLDISVARNAEEGPRSILAVKMEELKFNRPNALFVEVLRPSVDNMNPNFAEQDSLNNEITVSGENFDAGMKIKFTSPSITLKRMEITSDRSFTMVIDVADSAVPGNEAFFLTNPEQNAVSFPDKFRIIKKQYDYKISLVMPGMNCLDIKKEQPTGLDAGSSPYKISSLYPVFKWISTAKSFNFGLYTAIEGQREVAEIISNRPMYAVEGLTTDNLVYPLKAKELRTGKRYYWKVDAIFRDKTIQSEVWCFEVSETAVR